MKGEEKLWEILNDKLETLRASSRLPEAIRVAETLLELAKRTFGEDDNALALSYEKLGQLLDQSGDRAKAKPYLLKAHGVLEKAKPPNQRMLYRSARRLAFLCDNLGQQEEATDKPPEDYEIVAANYADLLRSLGKARKAQQLEARARKRRRG